VFDFAYDEIAQAVGKSAPAVRQIAHRARAHVAERRPRGVVTAAEAEAAIDAFQRAVETGDVHALLEILAPDVVAVSDGGGVKEAVLRPIAGAEKVARLIAAGMARVGADLSLGRVHVNGYPALLLLLNGEVDSVLALHVEDGKISGLYTVRNPAKLSGLEREAVLSR
jgi:RNA polymerase sigma-70 factor (ECF subfamily)